MDYSDFILPIERIIINSIIIYFCRCFDYEPRSRPWQKQKNNNNNNFFFLHFRKDMHKQARDKKIL